MMKYEYKTLVLPFKIGFFKQVLPDVSASLNSARHGTAGDCGQIFTPIECSSGSDQIPRWRSDG